MTIGGPEGDVGDDGEDDDDEDDVDENVVLTSSWAFTLSSSSPVQWNKKIDLMFWNFEDICTILKEASGSVCLLSGHTLLWLATRFMTSCPKCPHFKTKATSGRNQTKTRKTLTKDI